jgi:hypothetical protein
MNKHHAIYFFAASLMLVVGSANADTTITFGTPGGSTIAAGYGGFDWHEGSGAAINDDGINPYYISGPAGIFNKFTSATPFTLTGMDFQNWMFEVTGLGFDSEYTTVISGYLNGKLQDTYTAHYGWGAGDLSGLNIADVNKVTIHTSAVFTDTYCCDSMGHLVSIVTKDPNDTNFVSSLTFRGVAAPELDLGVGASGIALLLGGLMIAKARKPAGTARGGR